MKEHSLILIIDDNPNDILFSKRVISKYRADCIVAVASDGFQAIEHLTTAALPLLILLDLKMTGIGGIEILQFIRNREQTRYIPVVMLTSSNMDEDLKASYDAGANSFLHKMHDLSEFTERLKAALHYWIDINLSPI
ncbi:MAG: response regulator [Chitinivibrionales bacterium]|nr:response regulator [Chitinivibrionales bacterium]